MRAYPPGATADPSGHRCRVLAAWREPAGWCCEVLDGWNGESVLHRSWCIGDLDAARAAALVEASLTRRPLAEVVSGVQAVPSDEGFVVVHGGRGSRWTTWFLAIRSEGVRVAMGPVGVVRLPTGRRRIFVAWEDYRGRNTGVPGRPVEIDVDGTAPTHVEVSVFGRPRLATGTRRDHLDLVWSRWRRDGRTVEAP